jgi:hypothetical protein
MADGPRPDLGGRRPGRPSTSSPHRDVRPNRTIGEPNLNSVRSAAGTACPQDPSRRTSGRELFNIRFVRQPARIAGGPPRHPGAGLVRSIPELAQLIIDFVSSRRENDRHAPDAILPRLPLSSFRSRPMRLRTGVFGLIPRGGFRFVRREGCPGSLAWRLGFPRIVRPGGPIHRIGPERAGVLVFPPANIALDDPSPLFGSPCELSRLFRNYPLEIGASFRLKNL